MFVNLYEYIEYNNFKGKVQLTIFLILAQSYNTWVPFLKYTQIYYEHYNKYKYQNNIRLIYWYRLRM